MTLESLAKQGLYYTQLHTFCSSTAEALLAGPQPSFGRNGRDYGIGNSGLGYNFIRPNQAAICTSQRERYMPAASQAKERAG